MIKVVWSLNAKWTVDAREEELMVERTARQRAFS